MIKKLFFKKSFIIASIVLSQLLLTFIIQIVLIRTIGLGDLTDAYIGALGIPTFFSAIITVALQGVWLPRLVAVSKKKHSWKKLCSLAQGQAALLSIASLIIVIISLPFLVKFIFPGFSDPLQRTTSIFCIVMMIASLFSVQSTVLSISLRSQDKFLTSELIVLFGTIFTLCAMVILLPIWGIFVAVWLILIRAILVYVVQRFYVSAYSLPLKQSWKLSSTWRSMRTLIMGASLFKSTPLIDRYWASQASIGSITSLNLAQTAIFALASILERTFCIPAANSFTHFAQRVDYNGLRISYKKILMKMLLMAITIGVVIFLSKQLFIKFAIFILNVEWDVANQIWVMCMLLLGHLYAAVAGALLVAVFYALNDTKTPVIIGIFGFILGFFLKMFTFNSIGIYGLVISSSVYFLTNTILFYYFLEKKLRS